MKKAVCLAVTVLSLAISIGVVCSNPFEAQNKLIRKTITKVIQPEISSVSAPTVTTVEANPTLSPAPPPPPNYDVTPVTEDKGLLGWGQNIDLGGFIQAGNGVLGFRANWLFADPWQLGSKIGLSEDAVEYKVGTGLAFGSDLNNNAINTIPLFADAVVHLKEGSLFGQDPYVGAGLNYNLYGTDSNFGTWGGQFYGGVLVDFGFASGKTGLEIGYSALRVGDIRSAKGISFSVRQPLRL